MDQRESEKKELERVVAELGPATRPGRLLAYIGARHFRNEEAKLTEFNIATEVFDRSPKKFDASEDAVVRVEAHRLRKKLRDLYAKGQGPYGLQISLPAGKYAPTFTPASEPHPHRDLTADAMLDEAIIPKRRDKAPTLLLAVAAIFAMILVAGAVKWVFQKKPPALASAPAAVSAASPLPEPASTAAELHMISGYTGSEVIDNSGIRWTADRMFQGGGVWASDGHTVDATSRPFLFAHWRTGDFGYDIPLPPGVYEMHLHFESILHRGEEKLSTFAAFAQDKQILRNFDVSLDADGADVADEKVFRDISPGADGHLRLRFSNEVGAPALNAIEIVPGTPGKLRPIRITAQPTSFVDRRGQRWRADDYYTGGFRSEAPRPVSGTDDPELFSSERYGHFHYAIPVDPRGRYTLILHFVEFYFGPNRQGGGGVGNRIFHVYCNGKALLENFDVFKEAGSLKVLTKTFEHIQPSVYGKINLNFEPVENNATISGIEVIDESK